MKTLGGRREQPAADELRAPGGAASGSPNGIMLPSINTTGRDLTFPVRSLQLN